MNAAPAAFAFTLPRLPAAIPRSGVSTEARLALRQLLGDTDRQLADAFHAGASASGLVRTRAQAVERIVVHAWSACVGESNELALFAAGGFGRGELFPHSDVDLLALSEQPPSAPAQRALESFFTCLWDIGLKPGHALRTLAECRSIAAGDATVYTSLLDARRIGGIAALDHGFEAIVADERVWPAHEYLAAKIEDRQTRHARFNDTAYNLEPNLKDGPGGLRALQLVRWLGRRLFDAPTFAQLVERGVLSACEASAAQAGEAALSRIRFALHLVAGRPEERVLFDFQRTLALQFGFADEHKQNLAVEQFMQGYYRAAIANERLTERFLQRCEEALDADAQTPQRLTLDFVAIGGRLECDPPELLSKRPATIVDLFRVWIEHPQLKGLRADFARRLDEALEAHGADLAEDADVNTAFLRLLRKGAPAVEALARMNRYGVLARYLPAFARVVGRMQYDLFHMYTVDEHTMRVLRFVARFADADSSREFAHAHELWSRLFKPELLLLAALFHDIAKGRGGDHSELGEDEAREFCTRLQLSDADVDLVCWLVRRHLLMSVTAQRQDITDPDVVHRFAAQVGEWERLDYLYLLTVADIAGTSAKLWNSWKDRLLADLYVSARYVLRAGFGAPPHAAQRVHECQRLARELLHEQAVDDAHIARVWADVPDDAFLRFTPLQIAWQTAGIVRAGKVDAPLVLIDPLGQRGGSEVFVYAADRDGLFAMVTAVFDRLRLSVHEARIFTTRGGMSWDSFLVLDAEGHVLADAARVERLRRALTESLAQSNYRFEWHARQLPRSLRHFQIVPRITFEEAGSARTQLALVCSDRPGLLADVAKVFRECAVRVHDARIATFGERVEDFFLLSNEADATLDEATCANVRDALLRRLEPENAKERHVS
jgi:[protein-PII] uridylyltransferase